MNRVSKYVICHKPMYYYLQRNDSIVSTYTARNLDIIWGMKERHKFIEKNYEELINESYKILTKTILLHYYLLNKNNDKDAIINDKELSKEVSLFKFNYYLSRIYVNINKILRKVNLKEKQSALKKISF